MSDSSREQQMLLMQLLAEFNLHAVGDGPFHLTWEELNERVLIGLQEAADATGGSVMPIDGSGALVLHGEFDLPDILRLAISNNLQESQRHFDRITSASAERGFRVCVKCYGSGKFTQWRRRPAGIPKGFDKTEVVCLLCKGSGRDT